MHIIRPAARVLPSFLRALRAGHLPNALTRLPKYEQFARVFLFSDPVDLHGAGPPWHASGGHHRLVAARETAAKVVPASLDPWPKGYRLPRYASKPSGLILREAEVVVKPLPPRLRASRAAPHGSPRRRAATLAPHPPT